MDSKRLLFCSLDAALVGGLARQVHREGHDVNDCIEAGSDGSFRRIEGRTETVGA